MNDWAVYQIILTQINKYNFGLTSGLQSFSESQWKLPPGHATHSQQWNWRQLAETWLCGATCHCMLLSPEHQSMPHNPYVHGPITCTKKRKKQKNWLATESIYLLWPHLRGVLRKCLKSCRQMNAIPKYGGPPPLNGTNIWCSKTSSSSSSSWSLSSPERMSCKTLCWRPQSWPPN